MTPTFQPPRRAVRLLERALPEDVREHVAGDLQEMFDRQYMGHGEARAHRWYWRQSLAFALRFGWERLRQDRGASAAGGTRVTRRAGNRPSWLDVKLGFRMLAKYPALTVIGGFAIFVAIGVGAAWFEFANDYIAPELPLEEGDRIVGIQVRDASTSDVERRTLHDFVEWREQVTTIRDLSAGRTLERNLIADDGRVEPVWLAELTASAFRVARVPPLFGRTLLESDERPGAAPVVVIGHAVWQSRFGGDRDVLGKTIRVGAAEAEVIGVMPEGFAFPSRHGMWMPLRLDPAAYPRRTGPGIVMFGRLADGVTLADAQAELALMGGRLSADFPATHQHLRPRVMPYVESLSDDVGRAVLYINAVFIVVLIVACTNVATLVFARAATRERELAVRNALGASRSRIIMQLFMESLVLASLAAVAALVAVAVGMKQGMQIFWEVQGGTAFAPFWWNDDLSPLTILYAGVLTVLGAAITGILPALKVTGRDVASRLRQATGGTPAVKFGGMWTAIIVVQVAITVTFLSAASSEARDGVRELSSRPAIQARSYLSVQLLMDSDIPPASDAERYEAQFATKAVRTRDELRRQLMAEPLVRAVTFGTQLPGMQHYVDYYRIDGDEQAPEGGHMLRTARVDVGFFETFDAPILSGRDFQPADLEPGRRVAIVNQNFVQDVLGGRNPVGLRLREADGPEDVWYEIVGVAKDLGMNTADARKGAGIYLPLRPELLNAARMAVRVSGDPEALGPRLREVSAAVDPTLRLREMKPLVEIAEAERNSTLAFLALLGALVAVAFLLSTAGIYSLMALTVSQRTREIGVRAALGADSRQILVSIFGRALAQLGIGVALGALVVLIDGLTSPGEGAMRDSIWTAVAVAGLMMVVGLSACIVPARRGLRIQPTEALREG